MLTLSLNQSTPLQRAAYMGHTQVIETLLEFKANIDLQDAEGYTALHKASMQVRIDNTIVIPSADHQLTKPSFYQTGTREGSVFVATARRKSRPGGHEGQDREASCENP